MISLMAGVGGNLLAEAFKKTLEQSFFYRVMPNVLAQFGKGMSLILDCSQIKSIDDLKNTQQVFVQSLFLASGKIRFFSKNEEDLFNQFIPVFASGPAFIWKILEDWCQVNNSFTPEDQSQVIQLFIDATSVLENQKNLERLKFLRESVTSKKGMTEAGLKVMEEQINQTSWQKVMASSSERQDILLEEVSRELKAKL